MSDRLASALGASTCSRTPDQSAFDATAVNTWSAFRHRRSSAESVGQSHLVFNPRVQSIQFWLVLVVGLDVLAKIGSLHARPGEERNNPTAPLGGRHSSAIRPTKDEPQRPKTSREPGTRLCEHQQNKSTVSPGLHCSCVYGTLCQL